MKEGPSNKERGGRVDWYQSMCSGVLLILCISMAAVTNPSSVSLLCLLDPQTPPHPTLPYTRSPPSAPLPQQINTQQKTNTRQTAHVREILARAQSLAIYPGCLSFGLTWADYSAWAHTQTHAHTRVRWRWTVTQPWKKKNNNARAEDNRRCNNTIKMALTAQSECH